ncbi:helix-turn-helix transcriptional regulator [Izhakiella australiensis]|uniref:helix-turn-helix transcriptional regulator n=1 Tax=Izhakiella australiensis TaxID=1926881 RepID=UPI002410FAD7|nr:helix-turn-helix transcriptional regulator [Izhakiella australiensis]
MVIHCYEIFSYFYEKKEDPIKPNINLTHREKEVLYWIGLGKTYPEVAIILSISVRTVKFHIANIVRKLDVSNAKHAIKLSEELDLISNM